MFLCGRNRRRTARHKLGRAEGGSGRRVSAFEGLPPTMAGRDGVRGVAAFGAGGDVAQQLFHGQESLGVGHLEQAEFEMETLFLFVAELAVGAQHDLQMAREVFFAEQFGYTRDAFAFFAGNLQQGRVLSRRSWRRWHCAGSGPSGGRSAWDCGPR